MANQSLNLYHKRLVASKQSRQGLQKLKTLGISQKKYFARDERVRARYKAINNRPRERVHKFKDRMRRDFIKERATRNRLRREEMHSRYD
jgi:hypothetical protein